MLLSLGYLRNRLKITLSSVSRNPRASTKLTKKASSTVRARYRQSTTTRIVVISDSLKVLLAFRENLVTHRYWKGTTVKISSRLSERTTCSASKTSPSW